MKIRVTMKDQDVLYDAIVDAVSETFIGMLGDEQYEAKNCRIEEVLEVARTWFKHNEYLRVEIDTDAKTCIVIPWK